VDDRQHEDARLFDEGAQAGHELVDDLALGFALALVEARHHDGDVVEHDGLAAEAHREVAELREQRVDVG